MHPDNHWASTETFNNIQLVALDFFDAFDATLGINDMSLRRGGLFDICGTWNAASTCAQAVSGGHQSHRIGTSADIDSQACRGLIPDGADACAAGTILVPKDTIRRFCFERARARLADERTIHCERPQ